MKLFLDTNILVDLIANRQPFGKFAIEIFKMAEDKKLQLFTSSHTMATTYYLLKKYTDDSQLRKIMYDLFDYLTVLPVDADMIKKALRSKHKDFEDALQIFCGATVENLDFIITRNIKDFKNSEIAVLAPDAFVMKYSRIE